MGLNEQILAGATALKRDIITIPITNISTQYSGSVNMGCSVAITAIQASKRCRVRLYSNSASIYDGTEKARPFISQSITATNIGLIADINLDTETLFHLAPPLFGVNLDNPVSSSLYYTIDSSSGYNLGSGDTISVTRFLMEDPTVSNLAGVTTRTTLIMSASGLASGSHRTGSISSPKTYLLYAVEPTVAPVRVRLYTSQSFRDSVTEVSRSFGTEPSSGSGLIADIYMSDASKTPMIPVMVGRNDNDLLNPALLDATSETYYTVTNGSGTATFSASIHIFSLED